MTDLSSGTAATGEHAVSCRACGEESTPVLAAKDYNRHVSEDTFCYHRCVSCGLVFLPSVPIDLGRFYPETYYDVPTSERALEERAQADTYKVELVGRFKTSGRLLEIGPAYGLFAYLAKRAGFEVDTIEMDSRCCRFLREIVGVNAIQSDDVVVALPANLRYDVIAMWHVVEHLPDPWSTIDALAQRLSPGGILVIATPNPDALQFRILKQRWAHLDAPRHLNLIPPELLAAKLASRGLRRVWLTTTDRGGLGWNSFGWAVSFQNFFRLAGVRRAAYAAGRLFNKLIAPVERTNNQGSAYTAIFQRMGSEQ